MSSTPTFGLRREQLANGVTLLVQRCRAAPAASLATMVRAGFLDEPDALVGISHVLEHMLFKGTPAMAPGELAQRTKALGGSLNAYTAYDHTVYYASAPARHAVELMVLQADQVQNPLLDADELRRELGVIIQEANRKLDSPGAVAGETLHELLYDRHRIRRWRIGVESMLRTFGQGDVAGYHSSRYVPSRTIVSLVADVDEDTALDALRAQWGDWPPPPVAIAAGPEESGAPRMHARRLAGDVALAELVLGWRAPGVLDADIPALNILRAILALGRASRLGRLLREPGLVSVVGASAYGVADAGVFSIGAELDPARLASVLQIIGQQLGDLMRHGPADAEFGRALTMLRARTGRRLERFEHRALALAGAELVGDVTRLDREESDLLAVTPAMVREVARRWLAPDVASAVAYLPRTSDVPFNAETLESAIARARSPAGQNIRSGGPWFAGAPPRVTREPTPASGMSRPAVHHTALAGLDILTAQFGATGQTSLSVYRARQVPETPQTAGLAALVVRSMLHGTTRLSASALAFAMESLGGSLGPSVGADLFGVGTTVLSEHVRSAAELLAQLFRTPRLARDGIEIERALLIEEARSVADDMVRFPMQLMLGVAFNDTGYGSPTLGTTASLASFTPEMVRGWHAEMLARGRTTIVAVGDADPGQLADEIARAFELSGAAGRDPQEAGVGSVANDRPPERASRPSPPDTMLPGVRLQHRDRKQSALAMLFPGPHRRDPERFAAETWAAIAAGLGGRMFESLRSRRSLAYTVIANSWQRRSAGGLLSYIATAPSRLDEARDAMLEELEEFRREPPAADEVTRATAMLAGQAEMSPQSATGHAGKIADAWLLGTGLEELDDPAAPYRRVTADAVHALMRHSLDPALRAEGVVAAASTG